MAKPKYPRPTKKNVLLTAVYRAILDYQDGKLSGGITCVGLLDRKGTALYDRIRESIDKVLIRS